jgi:hypothetical protein
MITECVEVADRVVVVNPMEPQGNTMRCEVNCETAQGIISMHPFI